MIDHSNIRKLAFLGFVLTFLFGEPLFYLFVLTTLLVKVFRPPAYLALLFFSGLLKSSPVIRNLPVDFTLLTFLLFTGYFIFQILLNKSVKTTALAVSGLLLIFLIIVTLSILTTPAPWEYVSQSAFYIVTLYIPLVIMIVNLPGSIKWLIIEEFLILSFLIAYPWIGLGLHNEMTGYFPLQISNPEYPVAHLSAFGEDYMAFTSLIVLVVIDAAEQLFFRKKYINILLFPLFAYCLMNSPARGLTIGLLLALTMLFIIWIRKVSLNKILTLGTFAIGLLLLIIFYFNFYATGNKYFLAKRLLDFDPGGTSISNRLTSISVAFSQWKSNAFFGTGADSVAYFNQDPGFYAHNLFLEILFEYGLIGGLPMFTVLLTVLYYFYLILKKYIIPIKHDITIWFGGVFVVFFSFGMFSGTMGNMRTLWILLALMILLGIHAETDGAKNEDISKFT